MPYDHVTTLRYLADTPTDLMTRKRQERRKFFRTVLWQAVYANGVMAFGKVDTINYAAAVMNSAPSSWPWDWDEPSLSHPVYYLRVSHEIDTGTKIGASWSHGPYNEEDAIGLPPGREIDDNMIMLQVILGF